MAHENLAARAAGGGRQAQRVVRTQVKAVGSLADRLEQLVPGGLSSQPGIAAL